MRKLQLAGSVALSLAVSLAGCVATPTVPKKTRTSNAAGLAATTEPTPEVAANAPPPVTLPTTGLIANNGGGAQSLGTTGVVSNNGGAIIGSATAAVTGAPRGDVPSGLIANNAGNLTGKVKAPASLISDSGGSLISNNGGGIISDAGGGLISNNGSGYRVLMAPRYALMNLSESPIANAQVRLLDAAGNPIRGVDGLPMVTTTDANGDYFFTATLPNQTVILQVDLAGGKGSLRAMATRDFGAKRQADVELISTLTTSYILEQYVKTQADPVKTLEKLPGTVEAQTRAIAAEALDQTGSQAPPNLSAQQVVQTVTDLRAKAPTFDSQMETVKKILIAAGVSNLGMGLPATDIYMRRLFKSDVASDGTMYTYVPDDGFIWRIGPNGNLSAAAGNGEQIYMHPSEKGTSRNGKKPEELTLDYIWQIRLDSQERLIVCENEHGVWRIETDGSITQLHTQDALKAAFGSAVGRGCDVRDDGTLIILVSNAIWALPPGGTKVKLADATGGKAGFGLVELPGAQRWLGLDWIALTEFTPDKPPNVLFAETDPRLRIEPLTQRPANGIMDNRGNYFYTGLDNQVHQYRPDGTDRIVAPRSSITIGLDWFLEGRDSKIYAADCDLGKNYGNSLIRRFDTTTGTVIGGLNGLPKGFTSDGRIPLLYPTGMDVAPDGTLWVADAGSLIEIKPDGRVTTVGAKGTTVTDPNALFGGTDVVDFTGVRRLASGALYARGLSKSYESILARQPDGSWQVVLKALRAFGNEWNIVFDAWDVSPDGTVIAPTVAYNKTTFQDEVTIMRQRPGETQPTTLVPISAGFSTLYKLAFSPDGTIWFWGGKGLGGGGRPVRYTLDSNGNTTEVPAGTLIGETRDAQSRVYEGDATTSIGGDAGDRHIHRQALGGAIETIAGQGTGLLGGTTMDDSIGYAEDLRFDAAGNLYVRDKLRRQIRRIPHERL